MATGGAYIGQPIFKVNILNGSPFNGIPHQEWSYYFTEDNFDSLTTPQNIFPLPQPWNGVRCAEDMQNYDNFLVDAEGKKLEEAKDANGGLVSPESALAVDSLTEQRKNMETAGSKYDGSADRFFTWQVMDTNLFDPGDGNPNTKPFKNMNEVTNTGPKWMYAKKVKGDGASVPTILSPFMKNLPNDAKTGVHWACTTTNNWPVLQPFEFLFYHEEHKPEIPAETPPLNPTIKIVTDNFKVDISKRAYLALSFGGHSAAEGDVNYLILLVRGCSPRLYRIKGSNQVVLSSVYQKDDGEDFFSPNKSNISLKVEPIAFGMMITSNLFGEGRWIVNETDSEGDPILIGGKQMRIFSGNVKAGFAIRPVQYAKGTFLTSGQPVTQAANDSDSPVFTTAMKGPGTNAGAASTDDEIHAVDSEYVNGKAVRSFVDSVSKATPYRLNRKIDFEAQKTDEQASNNVKTITYALKITMTPSDVSTDAGWTIKNGRSPYLWQVRGSLTPLDGGGGGGGGTDVTCAVLSCDLTWSASSFTEFSHTGSLRLLMRPPTQVPIPESYTNRALYLTIDAYWQNGQENGDKQTRIFTGMTVGSSIEQTAETDIMVLQIEDYMNALEGCKFVLSPYYDGMVAKLAVKDIVRQLGLPSDNIMSGSNQITDADDPLDYGLPFNNPFEQPQFRFKMGSSLKSGVLKIAELDLKSVFFDEFGNFHYDSIPGGIFASEDSTPVEDFVTSPKNGDAMRVVWNTFSSGRHINDVFNVISVGTVDKKTGQPIYIGDAFEDSIFNPGAEGYLGFRKHLIINDPAIGSAPAAGRYLTTYANRVTIPPYTFKFETFGRAGLRPLSIVTIDGAPARIMNISMHADAKENNWWMNLECEWFDSRS